MLGYIKELHIPDHISEEFSFEKNNYLSDLNRINIFIGVNNSGKSRFIRSLFAYQYEFHFVDSLVKKDLLIELIKEINRMNNILIGEARSNGFLKISKNLIDIPQEKKIGLDLLTQLNHIVTFYNSKNIFLESSPGISYSSNYKSTFKQDLNRFGKIFKEKLEKCNANIQKFKHTKLYIPILRGLRPIQSKSPDRIESIFNMDDCFQKRTIHDYFDIENEADFKLESGDSRMISTGLNMYNEVRDSLLGEPKRRQMIAKYELFLRESFFDNKDIALIPKVGHDVLNIKIGEIEKPIYHLGDGLQSIIIITFALFQIQGRALIFLEEPELHLHPKWQRLLLESFLKFDNLQFFITTHSNSFINTLSTSIYRVDNLDGNKKTVKKIDLQIEKRNVLNELGYKASDLMQTNYILWVEGFSDQLYINSWLKIKAPGHPHDNRHLDNRIKRPS